MAGNSKQRGAERASSAGGHLERRSVGARLLLSLFQPRRLIIAAAALSLFVVAPRLRNVVPDLRDSEKYQIRPHDVRVTERPNWIPFDLVDQVISRAKLPERLSLLEPGWTELLAQAFESHPWVERVERVRALGPQQVEVQLIYRKPVAMVEVRSGLYPIDAQGVLLPPGDFSIRETHSYCLIRNIRTTPQGPAGSTWGDPVVRAAAQLSAALCDQSSDPTQSYWQRLNLTAIYAPRPSDPMPQADELFFDLETSRGSRIKWGRAPGVDHPGELSTSQKLGRLERYLAQVDDGSGPYEIDIRHWREITYQPIATAPVESRRN